MNIEVFSKTLMELMPQMIRGFFRYEHQALRQGSITPAQVGGLIYLSAHGSASMTDLARYLGVTKPSATALIDRLIGQGLVSRLSDNQDRRIVKIALTVKGKKLMESIKKQKQLALCDIFGRISGFDRQEYVRILREVVRSLDEQNKKTYMKARKLTNIVVFLWLAFLGCAHASETPVSSKPLTIQECFTLSLKQSEKIAIHKDLIGEAEARFVQALGTLLPHVSAISSDTLQDKTDGATSSDIMYSSLHTFERKLVVKQRLFSGFKELAGMSGSKAEKSQRINEYTRAKQLLWVDVSNAFYLLVEQHKDMKELESTKTALENRIAELQDRVRVGRSRKSEVVNTQAQLYGLQAQIETVKSQEQVARALLEFLTGISITDVDETMVDLPILLKEDEYVELSQGRLDIMALEDAFKVSQQNLRIAKSGLWPSIDVEGDYYLERNTAPDHSKWGTALTISFPIFEGTETYGKITQAKLQTHESQLSLQRQKRLSIYDARDTYAKVSAELTRCNALKMAMDASDENYTLQQEDYRLSLVSNLDVLAAIQLRNEARRSYVHSFFDAKRMYEQLRAAAGTAPTN